MYFAASRRNPSTPTSLSQNRASFVSSAVTAAFFTLRSGKSGPNAA